MHGFNPLRGGAACALALTLTTPFAALSATPDTRDDPPTQLTGVTVVGKHEKIAASVTATKTDAPPIDTPLNVQVVSQATLQEQGVISLDQALRDVSGVTVGAGGGADNGQPFSSIFLRGFSTDAHFRDGVRLDSFGSDSGTELTQFANIDSVTVLKGPSAILYGAVEPGGIVNIVTKQPQATPAFSLEQQVGSFSLYRTGFDATGPLTRNGSLLFRVDGSYENSGSYIDLIYNRTVFIAPVIAWTAGPRDEMKLEVEYRNANFGQSYGYQPVFNNNFLNPDAVPAFVFLNTNIAANYGETSPDRERTVLVALSWSHAFNADWSLKEQTLLNNVRQRSAGVFPEYFDTAHDVGVQTPSGFVVGRVLNQVRGNDYTLSENLDLVGHFNAWGVRNTLLFGGDFVRFEYRGGIDQAGQIDGNISWTDGLNPSHPGTPFSGPSTYLLSDNEQLNSAGVYLQDQAQLPENLYLLAGLRFQYIDQNSALGSNFGALQPIAPAPVLDAVAVTPRLGLLWRPRTWLSVYGNYAGNFGPSNGAPTYPNGAPAPPTRAHSWEVGVKAELAPDRLTASLDYYDLTKTNLTTADPQNPNFELVIGAARSQGVEFDLQARITPGWSLLANYAYTNARVLTVCPYDVCAPGEPLGEVARNTAHLWTTYEVGSGPLRGLKVGGGYTYNGAAPYLYAGSTPPYIPAWQTFDLMAYYAFTLHGQHIAVQINATNIADRRYFSDIQQAGFSGIGGYEGVTALYGAPRTIIGSLKVDF